MHSVSPAEEYRFGLNIKHPYKNKYISILLFPLSIAIFPSIES